MTSYLWRMQALEKQREQLKDLKAQSSETENGKEAPIEEEQTETTNQPRSVRLRLNRKQQTSGDE